MFQTGLIVVTSPIRHIAKHVGLYLKEATAVVKSTLYIKLEPSYSWPLARKISPTEINQLRRIIPSIYFEAAKVCSHLDVRVLQGFLKNINVTELQLEKNFDVVFAEKNATKSTSTILPDHLDEYLKAQFSKSTANFHFVNLDPTEGENVIAAEGTMYESVCLGGTFDRLHLGHKYLLSGAVASARQKLVVGVTDGDMIKNKLLWELIEPLEERISKLRRCLQDLDPTLVYELLPISDPYGPTVLDASLECLYVSDETLKGGHMVNEERNKRGYPPMTLHNVSLVQNFCKEESFMDDKISSSSHRISLLGKVLREPQPNQNIPRSPYVIGLTGGICTGKTHICNALEKLGATIISADLIGHETYLPGTKLNQTLVDAFGGQVRAEDGSINRKALGSVIFSDAAKRQQLNELVWPEIERLIKVKTEAAHKNGARIVVVEAALLFEGGWDKLVHQVWYSLISEKEAVLRVQKRDGCDSDLAMKKVRSQKPAKMFIDRAHVVLSSMWEKEVTQEQVRRAFKEIQKFVE